MKPERRGLVLVVVVVALSAALGGMYGANVRATASSYEDTQSAVRSFTRVLDAVEANYAEKVDVDKIDDKPAQGLSSSEIADLLRGSRGTTVKITVSREGYADPLVFSVTRDEIPRHAVDLAYEIKPGIGYIRLSGFNEKTDGELGEAMKQLNASTLDGLILDMRGNPGGLLDEAIAVGDMLLDKGQLIVSHRGRASAERRYYALRGNQGNDMPLVILVNNNSASATEIVAGAVQDHDRGVIVGGTTFGKGLVQTLQPLSENTGLALTIA